jgi:hypothetical protein
MANPGWVKGQSGNPGGRRKADYKMRDLALAKCPWALERLKKLASQNVDLRAAVAACMGILAYGVGKPVQSVDISAKDGSLAEMFRAAVRSANGMTAEAPEETGRSSPTH